MKKLTIDLGKGLVLTAPIKLHMTLDEWTRMTRFIDEKIKR